MVIFHLITNLAATNEIYYLLYEESIRIKRFTDISFTLALIHHVCFVPNLFGRMKKIYNTLTMSLIHGIIHRICHQFISTIKKVYK